MHPVFQAGLRSALALVPILIFAVLMRRHLSISDGTLRWGLLCGLVFSLEFVLMFAALDYTSVARVSVLFYAMPVWFTIAASFLLPGESLSATRIAGLALAVCGVVVAMLDQFGVGAPGRLFGDFLALGASVCWAILTMLVRATPLKKSSPEMQLLYQLMVSAAVLLPLSFLLGGQIREMTTTIAWVFAFQVLVVVAFGFSLWFWLLSVYPAPAMASYSFLAPVFGVLCGWLVLGEQISVTIVAALVLVCTGIVLINRRTGVGS